jgi:hypothetical protein
MFHRFIEFLLLILFHSCGLVIHSWNLIVNLNDISQRSVSGGNGPTALPSVAPFLPMADLALCAQGFLPNKGDQTPPTWRWNQQSTCLMAQLFAT